MDSMAGTKDFYDAVAARFGEYRTPARHTADYPAGDPEAVFEWHLRASADPTKRALDVGCGDGRFTLAMADAFREIVGIDRSAGMLAVAGRRRREHGVANVRFVRAEAQTAPFRDRSFAVVYSRRGPTPYDELARLLEHGGSCLHVGIGERDARELKEVFGRGQGFERRHTSWLAGSRARQESAGLRVVVAEEYLYDEHYPTREDLETFLQGVPIFEDFDPEADRARLDAYAVRARTSDGIRLPRHRFVTVAQKP